MRKHGKDIITKWLCKNKRGKTSSTLPNPHYHYNMGYAPFMAIRRLPGWFAAGTCDPGSPGYALGWFYPICSSGLGRRPIWEEPGA